MNMIAKFFSKNTVVTSETIRAEIGRTQLEISSLHGKLDGVMAGVATMTDAEHIAAEADVAAIKRAITRLEARVAHLTDELPEVLADEEATAKTAANEALRQRAEAARKANSKEAATLLRDYEKLASQIGDILSRLNEISSETDLVNQALRANPVVAEGVIGWDALYRKHTDREASEQREMRPVWAYTDGTEEPAVMDSEGKPKRPDAKWIHHEQRFVTANLERREVVIGRTSFRPGRHEEPLSGVRLPPAFAGGSFAWPRS